MRKLVPGDIIRDRDGEYCMILDIAYTQAEGEKLGQVLFGVPNFPSLLGMTDIEASEEEIFVLPREIMDCEHEDSTYMGNISTLLARLDDVKGESCEI